MSYKTLVTILSVAASYALPAYSQRRTVAIYRFAVQSDSTTGNRPQALQACPSTSDSVDADPEVLDKISSELQKRFSKRMSVMVDPNPGEVPSGALVLSGCIFKAEKGSVAGRMIGMNMGTSRLSAHVVVLSKNDTGFANIRSFDLQVKGGSALPPLGPAGLAVRASRQSTQTLSADAKKLADQIAKKLDADAKL